MFVENNTLLTEKQLAAKLNITRQAINKRKNKLLNKIKEKNIDFKVLKQINK